MLEVAQVDAGYGGALVLRDVSLAVERGEILCVMGRNGAGKTTLMKAIMGLVPLSAGKVTLQGRDLTAEPAHRIAHRGIGYVPQGRRLFSELTVAENLDVGLMVGAGAVDRDAVLDVFPRLKERLEQRAGTLSGGEQQMLATARAMCIGPKVMLFDEPTEGLQPSMIEAIREVIARLRANGAAVILVEQRTEAVLALADRVLFLENGRVMETATVDALRADSSPFARYVGV